MRPRYLADTHVVVRWLHSPKKLSREQARILREAERHREPVAISAMTLLEIALAFGPDSRKGTLLAEAILDQIRQTPLFTVLPLDIEVAEEGSALGRFHSDPGDRAIVATARVHRLKLLTSDQRIIDSALVPVVA